MKVRDEHGKHVIILEKGEQVKERLAAFSEEHGVHGFFRGLGALRDPTVAYYSMGDTEYHPRELDGDFELLNLTGNVSETEGETTVHAHCTLGSTESSIAEEYNAVGGHLVEAEVAVTAEIIFFETERMEREYDSETELDLINPRTHP